MSSSVSAFTRLAVLVCLGALPLSAHAQERFASEGGEYPIIGSLGGDQMSAEAALNAYGGYLVWQDNATDGDGTGISARRINRTLSGSLGSFRINELGSGDQLFPQVAPLNNGGAVFVWQSTVSSKTRVFARFLKPDGTFETGDIAVSGSAGGDQTNPSVASLQDGSVIVVWSSLNQERSASGQPVLGGMAGVFGQRFSAVGEKIGAEFQVNSTTPLNQRNPSVVALENGNFLVVWVSEVYRGARVNFGANLPSESVGGLEVYDITVDGQIFDLAGTRVGTELRLSESQWIAANPAVTATTDGFTIAWSGRPNRVVTDVEAKDGWDIFVRQFSVSGMPKQAGTRVNTFTFGDQFRPRLAFQDGINFVLWTSMGQDGYLEGVVARLLASSGQFMSHEFRVNTVTVGKQVLPAVVSNGNHTFLAIWSSFVGGAASFDLMAQRFGSSPEQLLAAPAAPFVSALSQTRLSVTWPELSGYDGVKYELYVDQSATPVVAENNSAIIVSLPPESTHNVRLAYLLADGRRSALSEAGTGMTWAEDLNYDGLPDDWQSRFWPGGEWPGAAADTDGDGASSLQELLAGTDPTAAESVLRVTMLGTSQGPRLEWTTEPGCIYQVQLHSPETGWGSVGTPRFAAGRTDSIAVDADKSVALYRVIRVR